MNALTEDLLKEYSPKLAIVVYTTSPSEWRDCYLESHAITHDGKLLAGKPLKQETINDIVDVFYNEQKSRSKIDGFIPENLLQYSDLPGGFFKLVWYRPAHKRYLHFTDNLKIPSGEAWVPPMIWQVERKSLMVYALKSPDRPTPESDIFRAPFHNVSNGGSVCLGSAKVARPAEKTFMAEMKYWEDLFWMSEFSHLAGAETCTKTNPNMLWKRLIKDNTIQWDQLDELLPEDCKLKNILK